MYIYKELYYIYTNTYLLHCFHDFVHPQFIIFIYDKYIIKFEFYTVAYKIQNILFPARSP